MINFYPVPRRSSLDTRKVPDAGRRGATNEIVPIRKYRLGTAKFPDWKCGFLFKIKENKGLRGDVLEYVAQARPQFDTEIGQKDHFRMETR
jgi:hypothetical protein